MDATRKPIRPAKRPALDAIAQAISLRGFAVAPAGVPLPLARHLRVEAAARDREAAFRAAGVGRARSFHVDPAVRGDRIAWIDPEQARPAESRYLALMEQLRATLNRSLLLGLVDFECHHACYPPGARYHRHRDRHRGSDSRILSVVAYLNEGWREDDGGELRLYPGAPAAKVDVAPCAGTLVCFLSDGFEHEVMPAKRERYSVSGWFRRRG